MKKTGIFYGSSTGNTQTIAQEIAKKLGVDASDLYDVSSAEAESLKKYDVLLLGSSTWGNGDLEDDWEGFIGELEKQDLSGKTVAVFGTGDSSSYSDTFCNALSQLASAAEKAGAKLVGSVDASAYDYEDSESVVDGKFVGLALDADNEDDKTEGRIDSWLEGLKKESVF